MEVADIIRDVEGMDEEKILIGGKESAGQKIMISGYESEVYNDYLKG